VVPPRFKLGPPASLGLATALDYTAVDDTKKSSANNANCLVRKTRLIPKS
jgi:hypothetical protein